MVGHRPLQVGVVLVGRVVLACQLCPGLRAHSPSSCCAHSDKVCELLLLMVRVVCLCLRREHLRCRVLEVVLAVAAGKLRCAQSR